MAGPAKDDNRSAGLPPEEMRGNVVRLVFGGDAAKFEEFCETLRKSIPEDCAAVLRGSAITGVRYEDGAPFDAEGPGTSDLDLTLVGNSALGFYTFDGFYVPGVHSIPLSDKHPDIAPDLVPLRDRLMRMVNRPVNIQGTRDWFMYLREHMFGQPYLTLIGQIEED